MKAEIITVGDELLIGQVINTNQAHIANRLNEAGVAIAGMTTVGDDHPSILESFRRAWQNVELVIVTGGLGPTHDDITKKAICEFFDDHLVANGEVRRHIEELLASRNMRWSPASEEQMMVPAKAEVLPNPLGTAPGLLLRDGAKMFIALPGVPYEMQEIMDQSVLPILKAHVTRSAIRHRTLRTTGIPESMLAQKLGDIDEILRGASLAFLPSPHGVRLRISVSSEDARDAEEMIRQVEERIRRKVGQYIYGVEDQELEEVLGKVLAEKGLTIAVAESCTGGLIADRLTNVSGSSAYFERGVVAYSNTAKIDLLGVPAATILEHGAVSKEVAQAMALGIRRIAGTDIGLSTTGIAGPLGGTIEKPVGLVWIGLADAHGSLALKFNLGQSRLLVKQRASQAALELVRRRIMKLESG